MKRFLIPAFMAAFAATPAFADQISLGDLSAYLNNIRTAQGDFTQINGDGSISTGTISMHRPGRIRFDYDGNDVLVMAGGGQVAIFDGRSNSRPEQYPLSRTPLNLILDRNVDLARSGMVVAQDYDGTATRVTAQDPDQPQIGTITLVFTDDPVELRQWVIVDEGGSETTVVLGALQQDVRVASRLFSIPQEISARGID
jgi:outer membrane lipoprotein-sorting protein